MRKPEGVFKEGTAIFDPSVQPRESIQPVTNMPEEFRELMPGTPGRVVRRTGIMDLSLFKSLNMRMYFLMVSLFLMGGNYVTAQQTPPSASPVVQPDKSWVLKDYPQAKEIRWKEEKKMGGYEFEFINEGQEVEIYFDYSGRQIRKKEEKQDRIHRPEQPRGKKRGTEGDDSQEYQY